MKERYGEIAKYVLISIGIAGVLVLVAAAPGALYIAKAFPRPRERFSHEPKVQSMARSIRGLQKNKFLTIKQKNGKIELTLTKKGKHKFKEIQIGKLKITKPPYWDKKWRIIIFDVPDKSFKGARDVLRAKLRQWEFYPLQKSVWVCPWPCENEIQLIAELYGITPYVNIIVAEKVVGDLSLRKHFNT